MSSDFPNPPSKRRKPNNPPPPPPPPPSVASRSTQTHNNVEPGRHNISKDDALEILWDSAEVKDEWHVREAKEREKTKKK